MHTKLKLDKEFIRKYLKPAFQQREAELLRAIRDTSGYQRKSLQKELDRVTERYIDFLRDYVAEGG